MEPTSFAASILTLLGAAGASTQFVYNFILDIRDVPDEIRSQAIKLRCLHQSISSLLKLYDQNTLGPELQLDPYLEEHLRTFLIEIDNFKCKLEQSSTQLDSRRHHHLWERLTWLARDRKLRKFYGSLGNWMQTFSTSVRTTQLQLLIQVHGQTSPARISAQAASPQKQIGLSAVTLAPQFVSTTSSSQQMIAAAPSSRNNPVLPKALVTYLSQQIDQVGFRIHNWYTINSKGAVIDFRAGPAVLRTWTADGKPRHKVTESKNSMRLATTIRTQVLLSKRITFVMSYTYEQSRLNFRWDLAAYGVLPPAHPAYLACERGNWHMLRTQLETKQVGINDTTAYGDSLLHIAAQYGHLEIVNGLLQEGARVDAENDFGETPLQVTIKQNCAYGVAERLLTSGADLAHQDNTGRTALHAFFNSCVKAIIGYHQDDVDAVTQDAHGKTVAHYVSWSKSSSPTDLARCSSQTHESSLNTFDGQGRTLLHLACQRGNLDIIAFLISQQDEALMRPDWKGRTLLHYATESSRCTQTIEMLVALGRFDIHARDEQKRSVLHHAASHGHVPAVEMLLALGATSDLTAVDADMRTPLELASWCGRREVVELLRSRGHGHLVTDANLPQEQDQILTSASQVGRCILKSFLRILSLLLICIVFLWFWVI